MVKLPEGEDHYARRNLKTLKKQVGDTYILCRDACMNIAKAVVDLDKRSTKLEEQTKALEEQIAALQVQIQILGD